MFFISVIPDAVPATELIVMQMSIKNIETIMKLLRERKLTYVILASRLFLGSIFLFSGILKAQNIQNFIEALYNYQIFPELLILPGAIIVLLLEIILGVLTLIGIKNSNIYLIYLIMLTCFILIISLKLVEGAEISCGCFGPLSRSNLNIFNLIFDLILFAAAFVLYAYYSPEDNSLKDLKWTAVKIFIFLLGAEVLLLSIQNRKLKNALLEMDTTKYRALKAGDHVPSFSAISINNNEYENVIDNTKNTILFIFSTNCTPCQKNIGVWSTIAAQVKNSENQAIGLSLNSSEATINYISENNISYLVYVNPDGVFKKNYRIRHTPQTILIDKEGIIKNLYLGVLDSLMFQEILSLSLY